MEFIGTVKIDGSPLVETPSNAGPLERRRDRLPVESQLHCKLLDRRTCVIADDHLGAFGS